MALLVIKSTTVRLGTLMGAAALALGLACSSGPSNPGDRAGVTNSGFTLSPTPAYVTAGHTLQFSINSLAGGGASYAVFPPSGGTIDGSGLFTAAATPGICTVVAMWSKDVRYTASATVNTLPPPATPVISAPAYVLGSSAGDTASVPAQDGCTYAWTITGGTITGGQGTDSITFSANLTGTVALGCTVSNLAGGSASGTPVAVPITNSAPAGPLVTAPAYVTAAKAGYTASVPIQSGYTYAWTVTGATVTAGAGSSQITFTPAASGSSVTFSVVATYTATGLSSTPGTASSTIVAVPVASVTAPATVNEHQAGYTASVPTQTGCTYAWTVTNGTVTAGAGTSQVTFTAGASGSVGFSVVVTNAAGTASAPGTASSAIHDWIGIIQDGVASAATLPAACAADPFGNLYVIGTPGGLDGNSLIGLQDGFLTKYSTTGVRQFTLEIGVSGAYTAAGAVTTDASGNVYVAGSTTGGLDGNTVTGAADLFLVKYDGSGNLKFARQLGVSGQGTSAAGVCVDANGYVYVGGITTGGLDGNSLTGAQDLFVTKYSSAGVKQSTWQYGFAGNSFNPNGMAMDPSGSVYFAGSTTSGLSGNTLTGHSDFWLTKLNNAGVWQYTKELGVASTYTYGQAVATDQLGNVYVAGKTNGALDGITLTGTSDLFITKFNDAGTTHSTVHLGASVGTTIGYGLATDSDSNVYVTGNTVGGLDGFTMVGVSDMFTAKYNSAGALQWVQETGPAGAQAFAYAVAVDPFGDVYATGKASGALGTNTQTGTQDLFIVSYTGSGVQR